MASKNVRKIYSKTSDELVKVDMADRDGQGRVIHETYATKTEASGGTQKYRHRISVIFNGGSGADVRTGFFSFDFVDGSSDNYSSNASINDAALLEFMLAHCTWAKMNAGISHYWWTNINGIACGGTTDNDRYVSVVAQIGYYSNDVSGTPPTLGIQLGLNWYVRRIYVDKYHRGYEENYLEYMLLSDTSTNYIVMVDVVEEV